MPDDVLVRESDRSRGWFEWAVFALYLAITVVTAWHHEPWRDEADPWLYVRDADYSTIIARTRYAGFPALWFLLLSPLAKLGVPYWSQKVLNLAIAAGASALVLWRSPFSRITRALLVFSYFLVYEYAVVVRSYALSTFLLFAVASLYASRFRRPVAYATLIVLLANTSSHSFVIAAILGFFYLFELVRQSNRTSLCWMGMSLMIAGGLAAFAQLRRPPDAQISGLIQMVRPVSVPEMFGWPFLPSVPLRFSVLVGVIILASASIALWQTKVPLLFFWCSFAALLWIFVFVYVSGVRHYGFVLVLLLVAFWMAGPAQAADLRQREKLAFAILNASLAASVVVGMIASYRDIRWAYSGSAEMAGYLRNHPRATEGRIIAAHQAPNAAAVLPYLGDHRQFWFPATGAFGSYMRYDRQFDAGLYMTFGEAAARIQAAFPSGRYLLLANNYMLNPESHGYRLLFSNRQRVYAHPEEIFYLYEPVR